MRWKIINLFIVGTLVAILLAAAEFYGRYSLPQQEIARQFHLLMAGNQAMHRLTWLGIHTIQNPNDVWIIQEIISETKPDFIVETGTLRGGSALIWAMIQREVNPAGRVITIDIKDWTERWKVPQGLLERIDFEIGDSIAPEMVTRISNRVRGARVLVILDSDHTREHVLKELRPYSPLVNLGSYIIVQDTEENGHPVV